MIKSRCGSFGAYEAYGRELKQKSLPTYGGERFF